VPTSLLAATLDAAYCGPCRTERQSLCVDTKRDGARASEGQRLVDRCFIEWPVDLDRHRQRVELTSRVEIE
jgi:hypothetical protein